MFTIGSPCIFFTHSMGKSPDVHGFKPMFSGLGPKWPGPGGGPKERVGGSFKDKSPSKMDENHRKNHRKTPNIYG